MIAYVACYRCKKTLEVNPRESAERQALESDWVSITVRRYGLEESFFLCEYCYRKFSSFLEWDDNES